jgi:hypothetical protein
MPDIKRHIISDALIKISRPGMLSILAILGK